MKISLSRESDWWHWWCSCTRRFRPSSLR